MEKRVQSLRAKLTLIERKIDQLVDQLVEADDPTLIAVYEKKIKSLRRGKAGFEQKNPVQRGNEVQLR